MRDWKKIRYYPVSIEKLQKASMKEVAYLIAPMNIGEDYEYFDEVKHLLDIPESPKSVEQIQQELNAKIDDLIVETKRRFFISAQSADYRFKQFCKNQDYVFRYMIENGHPPRRYGITLTGANGSFGIIDLMPKDSVGYYEIAPEYRVGLKQKPSAFVRFMIRVFLNWGWEDA